MKFRTQVKGDKALFDFSHADSILLIGSCFAENIGEKLESHFFAVDVNPFGTLYNPASVAAGLRMLIENRQLNASALFFHENLFRSFTHHSRFSAPTEAMALQLMNDRLSSSAALLKDADRLVVTFGTAWVYRLKSHGHVVANCHKLPEKMFIRERLSAEEIVAGWSDLLHALRQINPKLKVLFTVSPVRHWKDGANGNQLSKAILLLAVDELKRLFPDYVDYFPAYEIMMDELRDYRFYADDMLHPSPLAVDYIWECFSEQHFTRETRTLLKELTEIDRALNHKPFDPGGEAYKKFLSRTLEKAEHINERLDSARLSMVIARIKDRLIT